MPPQSSVAAAAFARVVLQVTGLVVVVVLGFYLPPTARPYGDRYRTVKIDSILCFSSLSIG